MIFRLLILYLGLISYSTIAFSKNTLEINYDTNSLLDSAHHTYLIETNSEDIINFDIIMSNSANDTNCSNMANLTTDSVSKNVSVKKHFDFSRKSSPNIALYEWHLCFVHDGTIYKAWRGFDPGPNTTLKVKCFIPVTQFAAKKTERYLCKATTVTHPDSNYSEFAKYCWEKDICRRFETESDYNLFLRRGAENVALHQIESSMKVQKKLVKYEYIDEEQSNERRSTWITDQKKHCDALDGWDKKWCLKELTDMKMIFSYDLDRGYRITEKSLINAFDELNAKNIELEDVIHLAYQTTAQFEVHKIEEHIVSFYSVVCFDEDRREKSALCTLILNRAFYTDNPLEYFDIEETSDVDTALWAYSAHKGVDIVSANERLSNWLRHPRKVSLIEIDADIAKFSFNSEACLHQVLYRIVGENEELEFLRVEGEYCI